MSTARQQNNFGKRTLKTRSANKQHQTTVNCDVSSNNSAVGVAGESLNVANSNGLLKVKRPRKRIRKVAQFTLKQSRSLVYFAFKYMVDNFGGVLQMRSKMSEDAWEEVASHLNTIPGKQKPAKQWARCFVSKKHFITCKFIDCIKSQKAQHGDNFCPDWRIYTFFDLLFLQEYRLRGYPNMPCVGKLLKLIEEKRLYQGGGKIFFPPNADISRYTCDPNNADDTDCMLLFEMGSSNNPSNFPMEESFEQDTQPGLDSNEPLVMPQWVTAKKASYFPYLAFLVAKFKVKLYGSYISKICNGFNLATWQIISDHFESNLGIKKSAKGWRKNYWAHQYIVQRRFQRRKEEEEKETGPQPINWYKVNVDDLLYLQSMRFKGHEDMPGIDLILKAYETNQKYINCDDFEVGNIEEIMPTNSSSYMTNGSPLKTQRFFTHNNDFNMDHSMTEETNGYAMPVHSVFDTEDLDIKTEPCYDFTVEEINDDLPELIGENVVAEDVNNFPLNVIENPALVEQDFHRTHQDSHTAYSNMYKEQQSHANATPYAMQDQYNHNSRLLEIKEKMLQAKLKKNKILRKKNKILKEHTKLFGQLLTKLDVLIEKKTS